jgi:putative SOS response-associated peptidase YedK
MCGRFSLSQPTEALAQRFQLDEVPPLESQYNIAPTNSVATVLVYPANKKRQFRLLHWGLIPSWAKNPQIGAKMINARAETVAQKPAFRAAFRHRRCLVLADGFYEWQQLEGKKQPYYIQIQDGQPFAFAGLWEHWKGSDGSVIDSCTLLTTEPNELLRPLHNRMPVILKPENHDLWLDPDVQQPDLLHPLLCPYPSKEMVAFPVSKQVNNPANNTPELVKAV